MSDIERIYDKIEKVYDCAISLQKDISNVEATVRSHLDASEVRIRYYDTTFTSIEKRITELQKQAKIISDFRIDYEGQNKGIKFWKGKIHLGLTTILTIWILLEKIGGVGVFSNN